MLYPEPKQNYDIVIIGASLHGLATAYYIAISITETELRPEKQEDGLIFLKPHPISEVFRGFKQIKVSAIPDIGNDRGFDVILGMNILSYFHITMHQGKIIISI